jgi:multiple sugar transport system permease protein
MSTATSTVAAADTEKASTTTRFRKWLSGDRVFPWALVLPAALLLLILAIGPTLYVFGLAFLKYTPGQPVQFAGLDNFIRAFKTDRFWRGLYITAWFVFVSIGLQLLIGFTTALSLQRVGRRLRQFATTLMLIPMMIAPTVVGVLWKMIYKARYGALNYFLEQFGIVGPDWLADKWAALAGLIIADIWEWTPFMTILLLAGLQSLSREIYEAAYVDGSSAWQAFKNMTIPLMRPFIFLAVFLRMVDALKTFDLIFGITRGGPGDFTESIAWYTYKVGFTYFELGYAAAISVIQLLIIIVLGRVLLNQLSRVRQESRA